MTIMRTRARIWLRIAAVAFLAACPISQPLAQAGFDNDQAIDTIVGTEVGEEQSRAAVDAGKVIAAIEKTQDSIGRIRKTSTLDKVDIVFLEDAAAAEGGPPPAIEAKVEEHEADIAELRKELEGNAMLFHAIDSRNVMVPDVLAIDFDDAARVVIYAAARKPD